MEALTADGPEPAGAPPRARRALGFVGFMGAGKTTAARTVAQALDVSDHDSDRELEQALGEPIEALFDREGEHELRRREEEVVLDLLARSDVRVLALGGGSLASDRVRDALRERTDSCTVPAAAVVGEAMVALVLGSAYREKFGGDRIDDVLAALRAYRERIGWRR